MKALTFENQPLDLIERDGRLWLRATDVSKALGYSRTDKVTRIYSLHKEEFSPSMTVCIETPVSGFSGLTAESRLFSLRGAHLLGMFARTANGMKFRRWVLDQLEAQEQQNKDSRSLMAEWYEAKAALDGQNRFASLCGRGLSEHRRYKPPLVQNIDRIAEKLQPSLSFI